MDVPMADLSDEQLLTADASESTKRHSEDIRKADVREKLSIILRHISDEDRQPLIRKEIQGLTLKELKKVHYANEGTRKVRLFRARKRALAAHERLPAQGAK